VRPPGAPVRIAVLASGGGSNLQALLDYFGDAGRADVAQVSLVASNRTAAGALDRAAAHGIERAVLRSPDDVAEQLALLERHRIDLVVLAGYLRHVPPEVTARYHGRMLNVHPALLPAFGGPGMYGARVHEAVIAAGARVSGATVHFVDEHYDRGAVVAQWPVPVHQADTPADLAARVLVVEHLLLTRAVHAVAAGAVWLDADGRARRTEPAARRAFALTDDAAHVGRTMDAALSLDGAPGRPHADSPTTR
jgi:phosphoribosylglycinamide formyltransferase-1